MCVLWAVIVCITSCQDLLLCRWLTWAAGQLVGRGSAACAVQCCTCCCALQLQFCPVPLPGALAPISRLGGEQLIMQQLRVRHCGLAVCQIFAPAACLPCRRCAWRAYFRPPGAVVACAVARPLTVLTAQGNSSVVSLWLRPWGCVYCFSVCFCLHFDKHIWALLLC